MTTTTGLLLAALLCLADAQNVSQVTVLVRPEAIGRTKLGYVSFNFDWHKNDEPSWNFNASIMTLRLGDRNLLGFAKRLAGAHVRVGGSEADMVIYDTAGNACSDYPGTDPAFCLSMSRWKEIVNFTQATGTKLVFGLNAMSSRQGNNSAPLNLTNIEEFLRYTATQNLPVYGFELGNELPHVPPAVMGHDYIGLRALINKMFQEATYTHPLPLLIGPDLNPDPSYLQQWLPLVADAINATTYHNYVMEGDSPVVAEQIMTPGYLDEGPIQIAGVMAAWRTLGQPNGIDIWAGEIAACWHSGQANITDRFEGTFWYADALAARVALNTSAFCRQAAIGGDYELLDRSTDPYRPNPDAYVAALFTDLMGLTALNASLSVPGSGYFRPWAQCGRKGGLVLLFVNIDSNSTYRTTVSSFTKGLEMEVYELSADSLSSAEMKLNGEILMPLADGSLPEMTGVKTSYSGSFDIKPLTTVFVAFPGVELAGCRQ
ncbi:Heparanase-like protein 3 [Diplonema papillatum]|nr:Heparanase-like protein 3 [Diplonema papillatum]